MTDAREPVEVVIDEVLIDRGADKTTIMLTEEGHLVIRTPDDLHVRRIPAPANDTATAVAKGSLELGQKLQDGSVFAGLTADGKQQIFAMPTDLDVTVIFNDAAKAVEKLNSKNTLGHNDWQIPALDSLHILQKNQNEGSLKGTFKTAYAGGSDYPDWYWSSTPHPNTPVLVGFVPFWDGDEGWDRRDNHRLSCRPVRLVAAPGL